MADDKRQEHVDALLNFLHVAIHAILHARGVYPAEIFERRKAFGMATWMSRHPQLNDAIWEALHHMHAQLSSNSVDAVILVLQDADTGAVTEQYTFMVDTCVAHAVAATYSDVEASFASAILRIAALEAVLAPVQAGTTFNIMMSVHERLVGANEARVGGSVAAAGVLAHGSYWMRVDEGDPEATVLAATARGAAVPSTAAAAAAARYPRPAPARLLKSLKAGQLAVDVYMEQAYTGAGGER